MKYIGFCHQELVGATYFLGLNKIFIRLKDNFLYSSLERLRFFIYKQHTCYTPICFAFYEVKIKILLQFSSKSSVKGLKWQSRPRGFYLFVDICTIKNYSVKSYPRSITTSSILTWQFLSSPLFKLILNKEMPLYLWTMEGLIQIYVIDFFS